MAMMPGCLHLIWHYSSPRLQWFDGVNCVSKLLSAYRSAKQSLPFEIDFPEARENVSEYAESFLYSHADLKLLEIAPSHGWDVVFDHMAICWGSHKYKDSEQVSALLKQEHDYVLTQFGSEAYYQFRMARAYPVYKMLESGQV